MTRMTYDSGDTVFPDGERLHEAFADELDDRPGLEGPSFDAVLRSGTTQLRRRRATMGATFAVTSVAAVATVALATGGTTRGVDSAASPAAGTTLSAPASAPSLITTPASAPGTDTKSAPASHPADAVLASGTVEGHAWQLVRKFSLDVKVDVPDQSAPLKDRTPQWCGDLDVIVDGVQTNAGNGDTPCLKQDGTAQVPADPAHPGFTSIAIIDAHHDRLGTLVTGSVSPLITSVMGQCATKPLTAQASQPTGDTNAYYAFTLPNGSGCQRGSLSFFNASGARTASLPDVLFEGGK